MSRVGLGVGVLSTVEVVLVALDRRLSCSRKWYR